MSDNTARNEAARAEIFNRIHDALAQSQREPAGPIPRNYRLVGDNPAGSEPVIQMLVSALEDYKAHVVRCPQSQVETALAQAVAESKRVVVPAGLEQSWREAIAAAGCEVCVDDHLNGQILTNAELDQCDTVVTASRCAIAISGTVILDGEPDQGRRAISLVPDAHVCIVRASDIYEVVPEAVAVLAEHPQRACTWFAGPSATSDIELRRVDGVHGPRNLTVIITE